jgi:prepilin-type N-terminal cleavage/methylation domain-containing protein
MRSPVQAIRYRHPRFLPNGIGRAGFTLIEMAIVIVIVGIIISIVATVLPSLIASSKIRQARAQLAAADNALQGYSIANLRLPFADGNGDGLEDTGVFSGTLPYRSLGLSNGSDVWGNPIRYAVYGVAGGANNLTQNFADANAFCAAITNASKAAFDINIAHTTTASPCGGATGTNASNQAYVLASGGVKDMDGANGYFDDCNTATGTGFNIPGKIQDTGYDDLVRAYSLNELNQKNCGGGGSGSVTPSESTAAGNCADGLDNDGDGNTDCADSGCSTDPSCTGPSPLTITTTSIPGGVLNSTYMTTFSASGGTTPYTWSLTANGGFSDFSINPSTGTLTGTLDQCPGPPDYTVAVNVQDATLPADGGPFSDSASFALQVTGDLAVNRTSGSGSSITWSSATQQETFATSGALLGSVDWTLNTGGATGFEVVSTGSTTGRIQKTGTTAIGTYTFVLMATDASCATNTASLTLTVTVTGSGAGAPGNLGGVVDTLEFSTSNAYTPDLIHTSGEYFAIAYTTNANNGVLQTVRIDSGGNIATGSTAYFDSQTGHAPDILHINGDVFAVAYEGPNSDGWLKTLNIDSAGGISGTGQSLEFEPSQGEQTDMVHVAGNVYAIVYRGRTGGSNDGWIDTVTIQPSGAVSGPLDRFEYDNSQGEEASIVQVSGDLFAIAYRGPGDDGWVKTVTIDAAGTITGTGQALEFDSWHGRNPVIVSVGNGIFAIAYQGPWSHGWIKTVSIDAAGAITGPIASLEFDTTYADTPDMINLAGDVYAVAYEGPDSDGWIKTLTIDSTGQLALTGSSLEFDPVNCNSPSLSLVSSSLIAVAYSGAGSNGYIKTISLQ